MSLLEVVISRIYWTSAGSLESQKLSWWLNFAIKNNSNLKDFLGFLHPSLLHQTVVWLDFAFSSLEFNHMFCSPLQSGSVFSADAVNVSVWHRGDAEQKPSTAFTDMFCLNCSRWQTLLLASFWITFSFDLPFRIIFCTLGAQWLLYTVPQVKHFISTTEVSTL